MARRSGKKKKPERLRLTSGLENCFGSVQPSTLYRKVTSAAIAQTNEDEQIEKLTARSRSMAGEINRSFPEMEGACRRNIYACRRVVPTKDRPSSRVKASSRDGGFSGRRTGNRSSAAAKTSRSLLGILEKLTY